MYPEGVAMMHDLVEIVIDAGGTSRIYKIAATRAGRRVEITHSRNVVEVAEVTRNGTPVRTARFMAARILALVEHPATETVHAGAESAQLAHRIAA